MVPFCNKIGELLNIVQSKTEGLTDGNHHARLKRLKNGHISIQVEPFQCDVFTSQEIALKLFMPKGQDLPSLA
jgi:hypothetical protein